MKHFASSRFWALYESLPSEIREIADKNHPSLHFKRIADLWSVRIGLHHRALGVPMNGDVLWFWIGTHADYDKIVG